MANTFTTHIDVETGEETIHVFTDEEQAAWEAAQPKKS